MTIIAGPCVIESPALLREVAGELARIKKELNVEIYFKASFDKANRTSLSSFRGPGIEKGITMLEAIREEFGLPITTDFHTPEQIASHGHRVDIIQIPAFLCRQTDMLIEAGKTGKIVNIKKAQFLNAEKMQFAVDKVKSTGNDQVWLTERGTLFGPSELVVDFRNIQKLAALTDHVVMDCTHSAQETHAVKLGKTIVALLAMLLAIDNGYQAALMAPTEILATQHYNGLKELCDPASISVALLTGSTPAARRAEIHTALKEGSLQILIGTHALIEPTVKFANLGLAVIDEQHRFGVAQRAKLWKKNEHPPHVLVMTATPIPRTLAMSVYGDLDISSIDELPPGRKPVKTLHLFDKNRLKLNGFMQREIAAGRQVYVVFPLIEESEKLDLKNLEVGYEQLLRDFPRPQYQIAAVHGRMSAAEKEGEMQRFAKGKANIMVATTVIEVGVNVPNASVMVIENAERFGLSQLHQLRGRVGRGSDESYCILVSSFKLSSDAKTRLETMVRTSDGFEIAEVDMQLRGPGDLMGTRQSGQLQFKLASLLNDGPILNWTKAVVEQLLRDDAQLIHSDHQSIKSRWIELFKDQWGWNRIS